MPRPRHRAELEAPLRINIEAVRKGDDVNYLVGAGGIERRPACVAEDLDAVRACVEEILADWRAEIEENIARGESRKTRTEGVVSVADVG